MTDSTPAMAIPLQNHTRQALGGVDLPHCESRSLFAARFADPLAKDEKTSTPRKAWFNSFITKSAAATFPNTNWLPANAEVVHARLMSRLMVDLAGGVMENASLNLNRYGLPVIPGSAVKGCARRMALQALHDWCAHPATPDDPTLPCRKGFNSPAEMLAAIAHIFGWVEQDWSDRSDFFWAANRNAQILNDAKAALPPHSDFAGTIAFLPATPKSDPGLELDVVTPHHTAYYEGRNPRAPDTEDRAPDTEDPVPVYFPAVKPQAANQHFAFPLIPLARAAEGDLQLAKTFLSKGLELLGVGAKTHAGYGWFEMDLQSAQARQQQILAAQIAQAAQTMEPREELLEQFRGLNERNQLQGVLNQFSFDSKFWPKDATLEYRFTLFHFVKTQATNLAATKKGLQAMQNLATHLNLTFP